MPYFDDYYADIAYPDGIGGLRTAQLGAIHAVASHFTTKNEPAIVVMPTGTGKTAVMLMAAYVLKARRVLAITGSRVVRNQTYEEFDTLATLKRLSVVPDGIDCPSTLEVTANIRDVGTWNNLREQDVVVVSPSSASPILESVAAPPADLFDLILVDEAHHSRAKTWEALINSFPDAKRVLFTATPFRRDQREINGRIVYVYPVSKAIEDGVFGKIEYRPVPESASEGESDIALALEAENVLREHRERRPGDLLMVRTDSRTRASALKAVYDEHTGLRLQVVHGSLSFGHLKKVIAKLRATELDGVICVNMLGEGFDLPALKVAAIHAPHKSLGVTLQFIGRFSRVDGEDIVPAKFVAVASSIKHELDMLYVEGADWQKMITELAETRVGREVNAREVYDKFEEPTSAEADLADLSLASLKPSFHVKIFQVRGGVDLRCELDGSLSPVYRRPSPELFADLFITKDLTRPKWSLSGAFVEQDYNLFIIYFDEQHELLFINSSARSEKLYTAIATAYCDAPPRPLPLDKVNKALVDLDDFEFWNIGMRRTFARSNLDSYKIFAGEHPHKSINRRDGKMYHRGHLYGTARENGSRTTIGYSSASKIWSNQQAELARFIDWCKTLAGRIASDREVKTHSSIDFLSTGKTVDEIPVGIVAAGWHTDVFRNGRTVKYRKEEGGEESECQLLDFDLTVDNEDSDEETIKFTVGNDDVTYTLSFSFDTDDFFTTEDSGCVLCKVEVGRNKIELVRFMNLYPPTFYFADFSSLEGDQYFKVGDVDIKPFDAQAHMEVVDWEGENVDVTIEAREPAPGKRNILTYMEDRLRAGDDQVVFLDDSSGEIADFFTIHSTDDLITMRLFHAKKAHGKDARLEDAQVVCAQVVKSVIWVNNRGLLAQVEHRLKKTRKSKFVKGDINTLKVVLESMRTVQTKYEIVIVQPGFQRDSLSDEIGHILAAANDYILGELCEPLKIWCRA